MMITKTWVVGPFQCNCRLIVCAQTGRAVLVDPGDEAERLIGELQKVELPGGVPLKIEKLLHTHGHLDHIGATRKLHLEFEKPSIALHRADEPLYMGLKMQGQLFGFKFEDPLPVNHYLTDEEELRIGELKFSVIHTPGHSPGSVCFRLHESSGEFLFSGDTLFKGSVGRTDLWGADQAQMFKSIRNRILTLDGDTRVCPGHGPDSTVGEERHTNPFLT